jgi:hypothetical protein
MTPMPHLSDFTKCRACPQMVRWVTMKSGKKNPLNRDPDVVRGNVLLVETEIDAGRYATPVGRAVALSERDAELERDRRTPLYLSHFATCTRAGSFRRGRS